jgi:hypothetical protein
MKMNDSWHILELREAALRDLADLIPPDLYGNPSRSDAVIDCKVGEMLKLSSVHQKMTIQQRRASFLLWNVGMYRATQEYILSTEEDDKREHYTNALGSLQENVLTCARSYGECLSDDERRLLLGWMDNNPDQEDELKDSERSSLFKLILGMAIAGYKFNPQAEKNSAISDITEDLQKLGIGMSDDTVRKWINKAVKKFPNVGKA